MKLPTFICYLYKLLQENSASLGNQEALAIMGFEKDYLKCFSLEKHLPLWGLLIDTVKTLNIGTPRLTTVVVLNIKQFNFTMQ